MAILRFGVPPLGGATGEGKRVATDPNAPDHRRVLPPEGGTPNLSFSSDLACRAQRAFLSFLLIVAGAFIAGTSATFAEEPVSSEYQVKAAFLINFPKYADWPLEAFAATTSPIVIAVLGETKLTEELQKVIAGRIVNGRSIVLKRLASGGETDGCHILFIPGAEQRRSPNLLAKLKDSNILTVGESDDFLESGGIINLARQERKIALEVNLTAAGNARIRISSKLLSVASVVKGKPK